MDNSHKRNLERICSAAGVNSLKDYFVDTSAASLFYTPLRAAVEYASGMDSHEIIRSRLIALGVHAIVMRPYGKLRQKWADYWQATPESSKLKKFAVDASFSVLHQIPVYSAILYLSGASFEEAKVALPVGVTMGVFTGRPYGYWLDWWRQMWGRKNTL